MYEVPAFFVEVRCGSSPHPDMKHFMGDVPRTCKVGVPINIPVNSPSEKTSFVKVRELEILSKNTNYHAYRTGDRWFIKPVEAFFHKAADFHIFMINEMRKVNRVFKAILPTTAEIHITDTVYITKDNGNELVPCWKASEILTSSPSFLPVDDDWTLEQWNKLIDDVAKDEDLSLSAMLRLEQEDVVVAACIQLISEDTLVSYYKVYEIIKAKAGGYEALLKLGATTKSELSRFTENAQLFRHANRELSTKEMCLGEAKLFTLKLLHFYIRNLR